MRVRYKPICCKDESDRLRSRQHDFLHRNSTYIILLISVIVITYLHLTGLTSFLIEEDFSHFSYPLEVDNLNELVNKIDRFELLQQSHSPESVVKVVDQEAIVEALEHILEEGQGQNKITPLTQFNGLDFSIDISPTCEQQWGTGQIRSTLLSGASQKHPISVILIVKSAVNNYARRHAIRGSWYLNQTLDIFNFKTVFVVGGCHERNSVPKTLQAELSRPWSPEDCSENIVREGNKFGDIIQSSGIDSYYNNTIKTFMTLRWLNERCPSDFALAIDDDYVFEVNNFINYLKETASNYLPPLNTPLSYSSADPQHSDSITALGTKIITNDNAENTQSNTSQQSSAAILANEASKPTHAALLDNHHSGLEVENSLESRRLVGARQQHSTDSRANASSLESRDMMRNSIALRGLSKQYVWAGYLRNYVHPLRYRLSKWYISPAEYAYNKYPPFITGGAVLMSFKTVKHLYYATYFTRSFKFDDVYVGILAHKLGLIAVHSDNFMCTLNEYLDGEPIRPNSTQCVGVHEIEPVLLLELWETRRRVAQTDSRRSARPPGSLAPLVL